MGRSGRSSTRAYGHCEKILQEDREKLFQVVEFLLAHETMSGAQFKACMEGRDMDAAGPDPCLTRYKRGNLGAQGESNG